MAKKQVLTVISLIAILLLLVVVIDAATTYHKPSKYKGLTLSSGKKATAAREAPCAAFGCGPWHTAVGDKDSKKVYRCGCRLPSTLKKEKAVCFMSTGAAKKARYKEEQCRR